MAGWNICSELIGFHFCIPGKEGMAKSEPSWALVFPVVPRIPLRAVSVLARYIEAICFTNFVREGGGEASDSKMFHRSSFPLKERGYRFE